MKNPLKIENLGSFLTRPPFPRNFGVFWNSGKFRILEFRKNFPGKIGIWSREFRETRIFLHFYTLWGSQFPGILEKVGPRFRQKSEIVVDIFRGKIWMWPREFRETRIFLHFYKLGRPQFPGISEKGTSVLTKIGNFGGPGKIWNFFEFREISSFLAFVKFQKSHLFC